jgi:hypothetical protein
MEEDPVLFEQELGWHHHGNIPVPAGGNQVTESLGRHEATPLVISAAAVGWSDVHRSEPYVVVVVGLGGPAAV